MWRKIVIGKINNQATNLQLTTENNEMAKMLTLASKQVDEGDTTNREAYVARRYFTTLFGANFKRGRYDDAINASLNYGYALIRAMIRREIAIHGLEASVGIHHRSNENAFNLSDDLIEVFRPFVDSYVYEKVFNEGILTLELEQKSFY
ncbi:type II CRISPR-associated endonuclease Cas1 [Tetragenococcus muriaticus]|uniref:CRISPR-associated Cas1 family helicase n=1 Tax=Tetragenococcus muriaticus 3MR10-3 TaxID=1302648 RepID=A0A091C8K0_9ENTE|nr:type II CRISPR-associated endonuclease Cas1 [Tetragenococcus muriaticus]KFN92532.1 CRISPR-associated Cas1 family helicase [Tetragenococcus muriaticus 3MR10-3]